MSPHGRERVSGSLCIDFSGIYLSFSLNDPVIYPSTVTDLSHESNYVMSSVIPPKVSPNVWGLEDPQSSANHGIH